MERLKTRGPTYATNVKSKSERSLHSESEIEKAMFASMSLRERLAKYKAFTNRPELMNRIVASAEDDAVHEEWTPASPDEAHAQLAQKLQTQIDELQVSLKVATKDYVEMEEKLKVAEKEFANIKSQIQARQSNLSSLGGSRKAKVESELKTLRNDAHTKELDLGTLKHDVRELSHRKTGLDAKIRAKQNALSKFNQHKLG